MNQYEKAIYEVAGVIEQYAYEKDFVVYGFGGIPKYLKTYKSDKEVIKCWNLAGEIKSLADDDQVNEKTVKGVMGILSIYHKAIRHTTLAGPTYFAGLLKRFKKRVDSDMGKDDGKSFYVMILLTDGCIHDIKETK